MNNAQIYRENYKPDQLFLPLLFSLYPDVHPENDPLYNAVVEFVDSYIDFSLFKEFSKWKGTKYHFSALLKAQLLAYSLYGNISLRRQADLCRNDIRLLSFFNGSSPCYVTFQKFQQQCMKPHMHDIFLLLSQFIEERDLCLDTDILYLDGTKYEANANKMTFVWMKATEKYRQKAWKQLLQLIDGINGWLLSHNEQHRITRLRKPDIDFLFAVDDYLESLEKKYHIVRVGGRGHRKSDIQRFRDNFVKLAMKLFKYMIHDDLAQGRNSFSKTDPDATFMHMKYDYYNHTNVFKPGYNVQLGISSGYIRVVHVSPHCNDMNDFIPTVEKYAYSYGTYPKMIPADAGYGSADNYTYCQENGIELMMKYPGQDKEKKITEKNRFRSWAFKRNEENIPVCPAGHEMELEDITTRRKGVYPQTIKKYRCTHCADCPMQKQCTQAKNGRTLQVNEKLEEQKAIVRENMSTKEGQKIMISRSIQAEGTFGDLKQNEQYVRLSRRGQSNVEFEILLVACGHNFRKYINRKKQKKEDLEKYGTERIEIKA